MAPRAPRLLQYRPVSDWRQIQARIRKARTSADPPGQLSALYERTHDAMVAFELAQLYEKAGATSDAVRWFTTAAERFRRPQWKQKAEEGLVPPGRADSGDACRNSRRVPSAKPPAEPVTRLEPIIAEFSEEQPNETGEEMSDGRTGIRIRTAAGGSRRLSRGADLRDWPGPPPQTPRTPRRARTPQRRARGLLPQLAAPVAPPAPPSMFDRVVEPRTFSSARSAPSAEIAESRVREPEPARNYEPAPCRSHHSRRAFARAIPRFPRAWRNSSRSFAAFWLARSIRSSRPTKRPPVLAFSSSRTRT